MPATDSMGTHSRLLPAIMGAIITCPAVASVYMTHVTFPQIGRSLGVSASEARIMFTVASVSYALAFFVFGPLSDRLRVRSLARVGTVAIVVLLTLSTTVGSFEVFVGLLGLAGVAAAAVPAAMFAMAPRIAPPGRAGAYFGLLIGATVAGITLGRSLTGVVAGAAGWRAAFLMIAALNGLATVLVAWLPREASSRGVDASTLGSYAAAARLVIDGAVARLLAIGALVFFGYLGVMTFLTLRLHAAPFSFGASTIGLISLIGLVGLVGAPLAGRLSNHLGAPRVVLMSLSIVLAGVVTLAAAASVGPLVVGVLLVFLGVFACQPAVLVLLGGEVEPQQRGAASSIYLLCCLCAGSAATAALGPVWAGGGWKAVSAVASGAIVLAALFASGSVNAGHRRGVQPVTRS